MVVKKKEQFFDPKLVERMYDMGNRDGFGMMWVEDGRVQVEKSMGGYSTIMKLYEKRMNTNIAVHVRNATFGEKNLDNCHPYEILSLDSGDKIDLWMMHNGTIREVQVDKKMSDSWNFATKFLRGLLRKRPGLLQEKEFQTFLSGIIGPNKLIFLDSKNRFTIVNEDLGRYHPTGVWISTPNEVAVQTYIPVPPKTEQFSHLNGGHGFGQAHPQVGNWSYKIGNWDEDADGRSHYNPSLPQPDAVVDSEVDGIIVEPTDADSTDNGTVDEEGVIEVLKKLPGKKRADIFNFVLQYHDEAQFLLEKYSAKSKAQIAILITENPWEAVDELQKVAVIYGDQQKENAAAEIN